MEERKYEQCPYLNITKNSKGEVDSGSMVLCGLYEFLICEYRTFKDHKECKEYKKINLNNKLKKIKCILDI